MADLTLDLHISLSQGSTLLSFHSRRSPSVLAWPTFPFYLYVSGCLDCTTKTCPNQLIVNGALLNLQILEMGLTINIDCSIEKKLLFNLKPCTHDQIFIRMQILHICKICVRTQIWPCVRIYSRMQNLHVCKSWKICTCLRPSANLILRIRKICVYANLAM